LPFYLAIGFYKINRQENGKLTSKQWWFLLLLGLMGYYISSFLDFTGLQYISAGLERLILFLYPSITVLFTTLFFKQKISGIQKLALLLTYLGIAIAFLFGQPAYFCMRCYVWFFCCRQRSVNSANRRYKVYCICYDGGVACRVAALFYKWKLRRIGTT
jgi:uncharacterized membrane protein